MQLVLRGGGLVAQLCPAICDPMDYSICVYIDV